MNDDKNYQPIEINGTTYLPMDAFWTAASKHKADMAEQMGCIPQRVKELKKGFLGGGHAIITYLVPVDKIWKFNNLTYD